MGKNSKVKRRLKIFAIELLLILAFITGVLLFIGNSTSIITYLLLLIIAFLLSIGILLREAIKIHKITTDNIENLSEKNNVENENNLEIE